MVILYGTVQVLLVTLAKFSRLVDNRIKKYTIVNKNFEINYFKTIIY